LYFYYEVISREFKGWTLTEIKAMPFRERKHWLDLIRWRNDTAGA
jgi:hypothetical protein